MHPTYTFSEIKDLVRNIDIQSIDVLLELIEEEKELYSFYELRALHRFINIKSKELLSSELKFEYLLSFN